MGRNRAFALRRFARTDEGALLGAIVTLLVAAIVAAFLLPSSGSHRSFKRERGSLVAPPADSGFSDLLAAPSDPALTLGGSPPGGAIPEPAPPRSPSKPGPKVPPPQPPPGDDGLLPDLPIIPPPPPPLRAFLSALLPGPR